MISWQQVAGWLVALTGLLLIASIVQGIQVLPRPEASYFFGFAFIVLGVALGVFPAAKEDTE